jgi:hypothetical protein
MSLFAIVENNVVINIIVAESKEIAETVTKATCVEYETQNDCGIGWVYDAEKKVFISPVKPEIKILTQEDALKLNI